MTTNFKIPDPHSEDDVHDLLSELHDSIAKVHNYCMEHNMGAHDSYLLHTAAFCIRSFHHTIDIQELLSGKSTAHHSNR